jgi:hypothetical protein
MDFTALVFDIEADGFKPSQIFCISVTDIFTGDRVIYTPDTVAEGCIHLETADILIGHYIRGYDCPVIERLSQGLVSFHTDKLLDTLDMSKALTSRQKHSLATWGEEFGIPKLTSPIFERYTPAMLPYCNRDVEINVALFYHLVERYLENPKPFRNHEALDLLIEKMFEVA